MQRSIIMFKQAIVRLPSQSMIKGITSVDLGTPDYKKALVQHQDYIVALKESGLTVTCLDAEEDFPDATFIEDVALITTDCSIITNPGADSRAGEERSVRPILEDLTNNIESINSPGTVEAGDVMMVDKHFYIGLSERTNNRGADQLISVLQQYGMTGSKIVLKDVLHLKTGLGYLEQGNLLATGEFLREKQFQQYNILEVDADEAYAANSVWVNGTVLTPTGFPKTKAMIEQAGYKTREVNVSEFQKLDGGLSCLSLRF